MNTYPQFKSKSTALVSGTVTEVFALTPGMAFGTLQVRVANDQPTVEPTTPNAASFTRTLRIWITKDSASAVSGNTVDVFEPKAQIVANGTYSGFGITLGMGEKMHMRSSGTGLVARVSILEHEEAVV